MLKQLNVKLRYFFLIETLLMDLPSILPTPRVRQNYLFTCNIDFKTTNLV